ncbi:MAG TPA: hypothetical protein VGM39_07530 [Kofleriaceae bacterium]
MSDLVNINTTDFAGSARHDGEKLLLHLRGNADYAAVDSVEELLTKAHQEVIRAGAKEATVDLRELEFMNSSCFKSFVGWITEIQEMPDKDQYKVTFLSNPKMHWQKRSLHSLRCFSVELISVVEA